MALLHQAELHPTKLELLAAWLPGRSWYLAPAGTGLVRVASYRFDDPAGEVGVETLLVKAGDGPTYQVPLTYRGAPAEGADAWLVGTLEHSVLGQRWVYDACHDPVYAATLASAILTGGGQAEQFLDVDGRLVRQELSMSVASTGFAGSEAPDLGPIRRVIQDDPTLIVTDAVELTVLRRLDGGVSVTGAMLTGSWPGQPDPWPLACAALR